jgi:ABC-type multidrug transport system fused ATPase/permease subunit
VLGSHPLPGPLAAIAGPLAQDKAALLLAVVVGGLAITLIGDLLHVLQSFIDTRLEQGMILDFRCELFDHAQGLSQAFYDKTRFGMLIYSINFEADAVGRLLMSIPPLLQSGLTLIGMFWIIYHVDTHLALLALSVVPFLYWSVGYYVKHIQKRLMEVKGMEAETLSIIHEAMTMLRVIVSFGREKFEYNRYYEQGHRALDARVKLTVRQHDYRHWHRAGGWRWLLSRFEGPNFHGRRDPRAGLSRSGLQAARIDFLHHRRATGSVRGAPHGLHRPRHPTRNR